MNGYRKMMMDNGGNLSWCKPLSYRDGKVILAVIEGEVVGLRIDGTDVEINADSVCRVAKMVNADYDLYSGWDDLHIIAEAPHEELGCCNCPWFDICDAMDNPDDWADEEYPDDDE